MFWNLFVEDECDSTIEEKTCFIDFFFFKRMEEVERRWLDDKKHRTCRMLMENQVCETR